MFAIQQWAQFGIRFGILGNEKRVVPVLQLFRFQVQIPDIQLAGDRCGVLGVRQQSRGVCVGVHSDFLWPEFSIKIFDRKEGR